MPLTSHVANDVLRRPEVANPWTQRFIELPTGPWHKHVKRPCECLLALMGLVAAAPLLLLAIILVKLTSRGPAFYCQVRLGKNGQPFTIYKIRTMTHNCERLSGARWCTPGDPRITPVGRWLRRTHLDELPQLWNVVRGDMSLIGPRPERPEFVPQLEQVIPHYKERLLVRPGLSGLAQIQLPADTDLASVRRKLAYDLCYVENLSLALDVRLVAHTVAYLMGVPFHVVNAIATVPSGILVEDAYEALATECEPRHRVEPIAQLQSA